MGINRVNTGIREYLVSMVIFLIPRFMRIYAGWFDVKYVAEDKQIEISASDAWGNDSPMFF